MPTSYVSVLEYLQQECLERQPGDRLPTLTELRKRFNASERSVLRALEELQRQGLIVRRQ
uniref:GntR family transcriptional regulator n=1 Tax=Armatimonas sp. TaxID=1872638 RepID=UPI0034D9700E